MTAGLALNHRAQQDEYRRLKRERVERLVREDGARAFARAGLQLQSQLVLSHDEVLAWLRACHGVDADTVVLIEPAEGGWTFVLTKRSG